MWTLHAALGIGFLCLIGPDARAGDLQSFRWIAPAPHAYPRTPFRMPTTDTSTAEPATLSESIRVGDEWVSRSSQRIGPARIRGSWSKTVTHSLGSAPDGTALSRTLYSAGEFASAVPPGVEQAVVRLELRKNQAERRLQALAPAYARASLVYPWRMEIDPARWEPRWLIEYVDEAETGVWRAVVGADLRLVSHQKVSEGLADGQGSAFPLGPLVSSISSVPLAGLSGDGTLSGSQLSIITGIEPRAFASNLFFQFPLTDPRFDEVQAYFYIDQAQRFFREVLGAPLTSALTAKVNTGGTKSNAAFYYGRRIFLGQGDGVTYQGLVRDPSVVYHEAAHALIDQLAGLPSQGEGGSLNEAFADFFAAAMLDNPNIGEASYKQGPYRRTLLNRLRAPADLSGNLYGDSLVVSGTLWDLRRSLGTAKSLRLAMGILARLGEGSKLSDFAPALSQITQLGLTASEDRQAVSAVMAERGWPWK